MTLERLLGFGVIIFATLMALAALTFVGTLLVGFVKLVARF